MARGKILVVEDDRDIVTLLTFNLRGEGYETLEAHDGREGLVVAKRSQPDLIILDIMLPEMDGFEVWQIIRAQHGKDEMGIIGISGTDGERVSSRFLKSGANDFLSKPFGYE